MRTEQIPSLERIQLMKNTLSPLNINKESQIKQIVNDQMKNMISKQMTIGKQQSNQPGSNKVASVVFAAKKLVAK